MIICAIDPGAKGALCFMDSETKEIIAIYPMRMVEKEIDYGYIKQIFEDHKPAIGIIEKVHALPRQGVVSMFQFGKVYGSLLGIMNIYCSRVSTVRPKEWQKGLFGSVVWDKSVGIEFVKKTYPDAQIILPRCRKEHDGITDAICIAYYGSKL